MEEELLEILNDEVVAYRDLLALGERKQDVLAGGQLHELEVLLAGEENLIWRIGQLEVRRQALVRALAERYPFSPEAPLSDWVDLLPPEPAERLRAVREELLDLAGRVAEASQRSLPVIVQWLHFLERAQEFWKSGPAPVYGPSGDLQGGPGRRIVDHRA